MGVDDTWWENWLCKTPISERDSYEGRFQKDEQAISDLTLQVQNLTAQKNSIIENSTTDKAADLQKIDALNVQITNLNAQIANLTMQLSAQPTVSVVQSPNFSKLPMNTQTIALAYLNKYPEANVTYNGRTWGKNNTYYPLDIKAWLLEGQNDRAITSVINGKQLNVSDFQRANPSLSFHQCCDLAWMAITNALGDSVQYTLDSTTWGNACAEFWQFASETKVIGGGDCDDKSIINLVGAYIAGIPEELLRLTAGLTFDGQGHCTHFYLASDLKWHHRNSTTNYPANKSVLSLPITKDSSESLNIQTPWFSATPRKTFNWFGTEAQKNETLLRMAEDEFGKFLTITRL